MVMTPLHMEHGGAELRVIGLVISLHVLGMFAFSPLVGLLADRSGGRRCWPSGGRPAARVARALCHAARGQLVADLRRALPARPRLVVRDGGRLDADRRDAPLEARTDAQGAADLVMGLTAAAAGGLAGVVVGGWGYHALAIAGDRPWPGWCSLAAYVGGRHRPAVSRMSQWRHDSRRRCRRRRDRRERLLLVPRRPRGARRRDAVRRAVGAGRGRHRGRAPGGVPAAARPGPRVPAAPDQLPRQPLGAALARRPPGARAVRGRRPAARGRAGRPGRARPARRPHLGPDPQRYVEPGAVHLPFADPYCARLSDAVAARRPGREARRRRWSSSRARASRPAPSRSTTPRRAGR